MGVVTGGGGFLGKRAATEGAEAAGVATGKLNDVARPVVTDRAQIEAKFKHAVDFGVANPRGREGFDAFERAVVSHVEDSVTLHIEGTYRGNPAILNFNPATDLVVVQSMDGVFVSGWRLSDAQRASVLERGSLGGG